jgi:hypothetical protein
MAFDEKTKMQALIRSEDRCECTSNVCGDHDGRCETPVPKGSWEVISINPAGAQTIDNCELVCMECFRHRRAN